MTARSRIHAPSLRPAAGTLLAALTQPAAELDARGRVLAMNDAWRALLPPAPSGTDADWLDALHHDDRAAAHQAVLAGLSSGAAFSIEARLGADPSPVWHLLSVSPTHEDAGTTHWYIIATDIDKYHASVDALRQSEHNLRRIIEHEPACVKIVSPDGVLKEMNPAGLRMIGAASASDVVGQKVTELIHPDDREVFLAAHHRALAGNRSEAAFRLLADDDGGRRVESHSAPLADAEGRIEAVVSVTRDVTERQRQTELRTLGSSVLDEISAGKSLQSILELIASYVDQINPSTIASIVLIEDGRLSHGAAPGLPDEYNALVHGVEIGEGAGTCGTAAARRQPVITTDISTDPNWEGLSHIAARFGLAACWSTPVLGADGQVMATFGIYSTVPRGPQPQEQALIDEVSQYVRIAIERTRQADHLRRSEAHYRSIYDMVPVLIWEEDWAEVILMIEDLERRGITDLAAYFDAHPNELTTVIKAVRPLSVNRTGARMFGANTGEELLAAFEDVVVSAGARRIFLKSLIAWAAGEREMEAESVNFDLQGGALHLLVKVTLPQRGSDETRLVLSEMDITAMRLADERFRIIAQATSDVVLDRELIPNRLWCSDGLLQRFGHDPAQLNSGALAYPDLIHPDDRQNVLSDLAAQLSKPADTWSGRYRLRRADGSYADVRERGTILRDDNGRAFRMISSLTDITEQLRLEEQLRQSQRLDAIGQLTGGVAHDFNNLLTVILGNTEILAESVEDRNLRALAEMCVAAAQRGAELTSRLLAFARKQSLDPRRVDVERLVRGLEGLLRRALGERVDIRLSADHPVWPAMADAPQLESAILNLCLNARDSMPRGGQLTIEMTNFENDGETGETVPDLPPGAYVCLAVSDTGHGMDAETLARAVEPFFTTKEVGKGSGLGLSMVYGFAKQSSGHVSISSEPGQGTTVRLYLPRSAEAPESRVTDEREADAPGGDESILLVEDDDLVRAHVQAQLSALGYRVTSVENGLGAVAALSGESRFDLLFTDVVMPGGMSGMELAERVAALRPDLPVLFTSGYPEDEIGPENTARLGPQILRKPYRRQDLAAHIRRMLDPEGGAAG